MMPHMVTVVVTEYGIQGLLNSDNGAFMPVPPTR